MIRSVKVISVELLGWLRKNIHQHGHKYEPQVLVEKVTGSKITPEPYVRYLTKNIARFTDCKFSTEVRRRSSDNSHQVI